MVTAFLSLLLSFPFVIDVPTDNSCMTLLVNKNKEVEFRHYGAPVRDESAFCYYRSEKRDSYNTEPLAYPSSGGRNLFLPALSIQYANGELGTVLKYRHHESEEIKDGVKQTRVMLSDDATGVEVTLFYTAYGKEDVIVLNSEITNVGKKDIKLLRYSSSAIHLPKNKYLLTHFHGFANFEMRMENEVLTHGIKTIENRHVVRNTHTANPSFLLSAGTESLNEKYGEVYGGSLAWNGNYELSFNLDETDELDIVTGVNPLLATYLLHKGETLRTPEMIYTYSRNGAGQVTRNFHDWARNHWCHDASSVCPPLLNSWEGAYFRINDKVLEDMVDNAAAMGLEMFVVDDGWFGGKEFPRNSDNQGLGDWNPDPVKFPNGMRHIADYTRSKGLKFGIWIEPEMINPKSVLASKHPEWIIASEVHERTTARNQFILDLCNPDVQDYVFNIFDSVMKETQADYIKWDCNRHMEEFHSGYLKDQGRLPVDYHKGLEKVLQRIRAKYPKVIIQACAGGGGRVQFWSLKYFNEYWTSDGSDALTRCFMQYGTNMIYPALATADHVSAVPNHQNGNITPLKFRFDVASTGRLGVELQPAKMTEAERAEASIYIKNYAKFKDIVYYGDLYRLASPYDGDQYALMYVTKDKSRAVVFCFNIKYQTRTEKAIFHLDGLEEGSGYKVTELGARGMKSMFWADGKTLSSEYLMNVGINPPLTKFYDSCVLLLEKK